LKVERRVTTYSLDTPNKESFVDNIPTTEIEQDILSLLENEKLRNSIKVNKGPLTEREDLLLTRHLEGYRCEEIAVEFNEDVRLISVDLNAVRNKVHYRLTKAKKKTTTRSRQ
jgi:hypothetical protein